jgi:hypothetical protein
LEAVLRLALLGLVAERSRVAHKRKSKGFVGLGFGSVPQRGDDPGGALCGSVFPTASGGWPKKGVRLGVGSLPIRRCFLWRKAGKKHKNNSESQATMKKVIELLLCILHPVAVVLIWINLAARSDLGATAKLTWGIAALVPFVPFVYVLTGNDFL